MGARLMQCDRGRSGQLVVLLAATLPFAPLPSVTALPSWRDTVFPSLSECASADGQGLRLFDTRYYPKGKDQVVEIMQPSCSMGGTVTRVNVVLTEQNTGQLGLGHRDCSSPELVHSLDNTWMASWYL